MSSSSAQWSRIRNFFARWQPQPQQRQSTGWQRAMEQPLLLPAPAPHERTTGISPVQYPLHQEWQPHRVEPLADLTRIPARAWAQQHPATPIPPARQQTGPIPLRNFERLPTMPASPRFRKFVAVPIEDDPPLPHWIEASVAALAPVHKPLASESAPTLLPEQLRTGSNSRPLWLDEIVRETLADEPTSHPELADVTPEDCEPDLSEGDGESENEPTDVCERVRGDRAIELLLSETKGSESENMNAND